jgi:hypothetical protein
VLDVSAEDASLRVLGDFRDSAELLAAVRVSCTIPVIGGAPATYRGEPMLDGGLLELAPNCPHCARHRKRAASRGYRCTSASA